MVLSSEHQILLDITIKMVSNKPLVNKEMFLEQLEIKWQHLTAQSKLFKINIQISIKEITICNHKSHKYQM